MIRFPPFRLARSEENLKNHCNRATEAARRFRERLITARVEGEKKAARLQYELVGFIYLTRKKEVLFQDMTCYEMAAAQNKLLHSIPLRTYEQLSRKYRELLKKETLGGGNIEVEADPLFDEHLTRRISAEKCLLFGERAPLLPRFYGCGARRTMSLGPADYRIRPPPGKARSQCSRTSCQK